MTKRPFNTFSNWSMPMDSLHQNSLMKFLENRDSFSLQSCTLIFKTPIQ